MKNPNIEVDKEDMYSRLKVFPEQIKEASELGKDISFDGIKKIVVAGMGGSALAGEILKSYLNDLDIPIFVIKDYTIPEYIDETTLFFAISYSGNTEETLDAFRSAIRKNANVVAISSGGKLREIAEKLDRSYIKVRPGLEPRMGYALTFVPLLNVLFNSGIIPDPKKDLDATMKAVSNNEFEESAKKLASKLYTKIPLIYSSNKLFIVSYKWKINFNENAKTHAFSNVYPEMNHNELNAYNNLNADFHVIILQDEDDHRRIKKRFLITKDLIKKKGVNVTLINVTGTSLLSRMFSAMRIGDWTAYYLALEMGQDPSPVKIIEDLKKHMK